MHGTRNHSVFKGICNPYHNCKTIFSLLQHGYYLGVDLVQFDYLA